MLPLNIGTFLAVFFCWFILCLQAFPFSYLHSEFTLFQPIKSIKTKPEKSSDNFGKLKLCPPGGRAFLEAFQLACPMKKRRKRSPVMFDELISAIDSDHRSEVYRPASLEDLMEICCQRGCELTDFFQICSPF